MLYRHAPRLFKSQNVDHRHQGAPPSRLKPPCRLEPSAPSYEWKWIRPIRSMPRQTQMPRLGRPESTQRFPFPNRLPPTPFIWTFIITDTCNRLSSRSNACFQMDCSSMTGFGHKAPPLRHRPTFELLSFPSLNALIAMSPRGFSEAILWGI